MKEKLMKILSVPIYPHELANPTEAVADYLLDNDVVPVVRCKDCKHCEQGLTVYGQEYCECHCEGFLGEHIGVPVFPNDFCSYGERRNDV